MSDPKGRAKEGAEGSGRAPAPCPVCGKMAVAACHPFCSRRCADIDLGRWLGGRYAIPGRSEDEEEPGREPPYDRSGSGEGGEGGGGPEA